MSRSLPSWIWSTMRAASTSVYLEGSQLGAAHACAIEGDENGAVEGNRRGVDPARDLLRAPDHWQVNPLLRVGQFVSAQRALQNLEEEAAPCSDHWIDCVVGEFPVTEQVSGVLADLFRSELVGWTVEMRAKSSRIRSRRAWYLQCNCDARFHRASAFEDGSQGPPNLSPQNPECSPWRTRSVCRKA